MSADPFEVTLADAIRAGLATPADADEWVEAWHWAPEVARDDAPAATRQLHEHLGLTWEQYQAWVKDPGDWPEGSAS